MTAEKIYLGDNILTLSDAHPTADAVAVSGGKLLKVGTREEVLTLKGPATEVVELSGSQTLMPGFIDTHGHFVFNVMFADWAKLSAPPHGTCNSISALISEMKQYIKDRSIPAGDWAIGWMYDNSTFLADEARHPTKFDLDQVSTEHPIMVLHQSMHLYSLNTKALEILGYLDPNFVVPEGGELCKLPGTNEPNGMCEGNIRLDTISKLPFGGIDVLMENVKKATRYYNSYGVTTIQDGATLTPDFGLLKEAQRRGVLTTDVISYPYTDWEKRIEGEKTQCGDIAYHNHFRMGGLKNQLDGSFAGTAYMSRPYADPGKNPPDYRGQVYQTPEQVRAYMRLCFEKNQQIMVHSLGDAAIDGFLDAYEAVAQETGTDTTKRRDVILHYVFATEEQSKRVMRLGLIPSLLVVRCFLNGASDRARYGAELFDNMCPSTHFLGYEKPFNLHIDCPVCDPSPLLAVDAAVNRITRDGYALNPDLRIPVLEALKAVTIYGAYQYFEEDRKGTLDEGKLANLVILEKNPLRVPTTELKDIQVLETIVEGCTVYRAQ